MGVDWAFDLVLGPESSDARACVTEASVRLSEATKAPLDKAVLRSARAAALSAVVLAVVGKTCRVFGEVGVAVVWGSLR